MGKVVKIEDAYDARYERLLQEMAIARCRRIIARQQARQAREARNIRLVISGIILGLIIIAINMGYQYAHRYDFTFADFKPTYKEVYIDSGDSVYKVVQDLRNDPEFQTTFEYNSTKAVVEETMKMNGITDEKSVVPGYIIVPKLADRE